MPLFKVRTLSRIEEATCSRKQPTGTDGKEETPYLTSRMKNSQVKWLRGCIAMMVNLIGQPNCAFKSPIKITPFLLGMKAFNKVFPNSKQCIPVAWLWTLLQRINSVILRIIQMFLKWMIEWANWNKIILNKFTWRCALVRCLLIVVLCLKGF